MPIVTVYTTSEKRYRTLANEYKGFLSENGVIFKVLAVFFSFFQNGLSDSLLPSFTLLTPLGSC